VQSGGSVGSDGVVTPNVVRYTFTATANGFITNPIGGSQDVQIYGDQTGQFTELASLYEFYRIN
jgi:hypothetical protein